MTFFLDNNLSTHLANGLRAFGEDVTHLQDLFPEETSDIIWLKEIGERGWILITRDNRIRKNPQERQTLEQYSVGSFFLGGKNLNRCDFIEQLVRNWRRIKYLSQNSRPPFAFRVPPRGTKIERIF